MAIAPALGRGLTAALPGSVIAPAVTMPAVALHAITAAPAVKVLRSMGFPSIPIPSRVSWSAEPQHQPLEAIEAAVGRLHRIAGCQIIDPLNQGLEHHFH